MPSAIFKLLCEDFASLCIVEVNCKLLCSLIPVFINSVILLIDCFTLANPFSNPINNPSPNISPIYIATLDGELIFKDRLTLLTKSKNNFKLSWRFLFVCIFIILVPVSKVFSVALSTSAWRFLISFTKASILFLIVFSISSISDISGLVVAP